MSVVDHILDRIQKAPELYNRLVLLVGPSGSGKTKALQAVSERVAAPLINVNLELARRLLEMDTQQRPRKVKQILQDIVDKIEGDLVLFDNLEILFEVQLKQDPLRLLRELSRNKTIVAAWNGSLENDRITYASSNHPEYRNYPICDVLILSIEATN